MIRTIRSLIVIATVTVTNALAFGGVGPDVAQKLYERATPSLVLVKYTWENELSRRDLSSIGIVVRDDGLIMVPIELVDLRIPDAQMKDFKILIPNQDKDPEELEAEFQGRDERTNLAFVKMKEPKETKDSEAPAKRQWKPLKFEEAPVAIGESILSVGLLPEDAAYKSYFMEATVSATVRGEIPMVMVQGGTAVVGSPVFNTSGAAIGVVGVQNGQGVFLMDTGNNMAAVHTPPKFFTPTRDFLQGIGDPPIAGKPSPLPWIGVPQLTGLNKDVADVFGLTGEPAVQVGEVVPETPGDKAGLKKGDIIVKVNGEPLRRGDQPIELPMILRRQILRMKVGEELTLSVLRKRGQPVQEIKITLAEQPEKPNLSKRFFAEDLGFGVRDLTFYDTYARRMPTDTKGVTVAILRPQSLAQSGGLKNADLISQLNGQPVTDIPQFETAYKEARKAKPKEAVVLVVRREGREDTLRIEPPQ